MVVDGSGIGVVPQFWGITGDGDEVADAEDMGAEQEGLLSEEISVAAADVHEYFAVELFLHFYGEGEIAYPNCSPGAIGAVDHIRPRIEKHFRGIDGGLHVESGLGVDFNTDNELFA